jgi:hypothetical protein
MGFLLVAASCGLTSCGKSDAGSCLIEVSDYDQSCSVSSDCISTVQNFPVLSGNYCQPVSLCPGTEAINKTAAAQYLSDVLKTPLGRGALPPYSYNCGGFGGFPACCAEGRCEAVCLGTGDTGAGAGVLLPQDAGQAGDQDAQADAEAVSAEFTGSPVMCSASIGPFDAGTDASGPWRWCTGGESCVPFNGGYACCQVQTGAGFCFAAGASDGDE